MWVLWYCIDNYMLRFVWVLSCILYLLLLVFFVCCMYFFFLCGQGRQAEPVLCYVSLSGFFGMYVGG